MSTSAKNPIDKLERGVGASWTNIRRAQAEANRVRGEIEKALKAERVVPADTAVVAFGSLARGEWTSCSDLDWTLLIDGQVNAEHVDIARKIRALIESLGHKEPGRTGVFGGLTFSHDIVQLIGGERDTNRNTTQRILLLLESTNVHANADVRGRVLTALLRRYVGEDLHYRVATRRLPRFLLNDIVRYWRTITVDYAWKRQEQRDGWALRNIKLRMSRKLIFAAGLWMCISCETQPSASLATASAEDADEFYAAVIEHVLPFTASTPLETICGAFLEYDAKDAGRRALDAYDAFLEILDDATRRGALKSLKPIDAASDKAFRAARDLAAQFQQALTSFFFDTDTELTRVAQLYGVF